MDIIIKVVIPVKGCNTVHSGVGHSPSFLLYALDATNLHLIAEHYSVPVSPILLIHCSYNNYICMDVANWTNFSHCSYSR